MSNEEDLNLFRELFKENPPPSPEVAWKSLEDGSPPNSPPVKIKDAPEIPDFEILSMLGKGGMGAVYKARQVGMDRIVALKVMKRDLADEPSFVERFFVEARTAGKLRHENIVSALDCGYANGHYYMVMEYVEGRTLASLLREKGTLPEREALGFVRQVALGLQCAAERKVIHRDIKPENILVIADGTAKICDLGLCRTLGDAPHLTMTGTVHCTAAYASPEQARGEQDIDARTDIYSLGVTLYQLVTAKLPFPGSSAAVVLARHIQEKPKPPIEINQAISPALNRLILDMMAKDKRSRPTSPAVVVERIDSVMSPGGAPQSLATAPPARPSIPSRPHTRRWKDGERPTARTPFLLFGGIGIVALAVFGIIAFSSGPSDSNNASSARLPMQAPKYEPGVVAPKNDPTSDAFPRPNPILPTSTAFGAELREIDEKMRLGLSNEEFRQVTDLLESARKRRNVSEWLSEIDLRIPQVEIRARRALMPLRDMAIEAQKRKDSSEVDRLRQLVASWGIQAIVDDFDKALAVARPGASPDSSKSPPADADSRTAKATWTQPIDLLKLLDPMRDAVVGSWDLKERILLSPAEAWSRIQLPYAPPEEYDLVLVAERKGGQNCLDVGLVVGGRQVVAEFDGRIEGDLCGLASIDGKYTHENGTGVRRRLLPLNKPISLLCAVRKGGVTLNVDADRIVSWTGDPSRLSLQNEWRVPRRDCLFLGAFSSFQITRLELRPLSGPGQIMGGTESSPGKGGQRAASERSVDLLKQIDPKRDAVLGDWASDGRSLVCSKKMPWARLQIPYQPPSEYDLVIVAERKDGLEALQVGLVSGTSQCHVALDGWDATLTGIGFVDGKLANSNETTAQGRVLTNNKQSTIICAVRENGITVVVDGRKVTQFSGNSSRLTNMPQLTVPDPHALYLGSFNSNFELTKLVVIEISGQGKSVRVMKAAPTSAAKITLTLAPTPDAKAVRAKEPDLAMQKGIEKNIRDKFKADYAKPTREDKLALAQKLKEFASKDIISAENRFVLLREARDLAVQGADLQAAVSIIDLLASQFVIDVWDMRLKAVARLAGSGLPGEALIQVADASSQLAEAAAAGEEYDKGLGFLAIGERLAKDAQDADLLGKLQARAAELRALQKQSKKK